MPGAILAALRGGQKAAGTKPPPTPAEGWGSEGLGHSAAALISPADCQNRL